LLRPVRPLQAVHYEFQHRGVINNQTVKFLCFPKNIPENEGFPVAGTPSISLKEVMNEPTPASARPWAGNDLRKLRQLSLSCCNRVPFSRAVLTQCLAVAIIRFGWL
jgi:hypothetical protein